MEQWQMEMSGWYPEFQALRHRLHREPERSFQEHGTTQLIRELLTGWGAEVEEHPGLETGLTALIRGLILDEFANSVTRSTPKTVGITDKSVA